MWLVGGRNICALPVWHRRPVVILVCVVRITRRRVHIHIVVFFFFLLLLLLLGRGSGGGVPRVSLDGYAGATNELVAAAAECRALLDLSVRSSSYVTDAGVATLARAARLMRLDLSYCTVTNEGVKHLAGALLRPFLAAGLHCGVARAARAARGEAGGNKGDRRRHCCACRAFAQVGDA